MKKYRLDELLVLKGLVESRVRAHKLILDGKVFIEGKPFYKPSKKFSEDINIEVQKNFEFVSRGGYKLQKALETFQIDVKNKVCIDIGASTGGFTDCLLKNGAKIVISIDNGKNQLHPSLVNNQKVINIEKFNAKEINKIFESPQNFKLSSEIINNVEIITIDVSFISATMITQAISLVKADKKLNIIVLIKPNFELRKDERKHLKKGVLKNPNMLFLILLRTIRKIRKQGFRFVGITESPIKGDKGNREFLVYFIKEQ